MNSWPWMLRAAVVGLALAASVPIAADLNGDGVVAAADRAILAGRLAGR